MMDSATLNDCDKLIATANAAAYEKTTRLNPAEKEVYERFKAGQMLLEKEKISHTYAADRLRSVINPTSP